MKRWVRLLQNYTFIQLFYLWIALGFGFAIIYFLSSFSPNHSLIYMGEPLKHNFTGFLAMIYFSFITLTSTGYGDIVPLGILRLFAILEIFFGLIVFGFLVSKLITARQHRIIEELYSISFEERVNKLRSSLYASRANISRIINKVNTVRYGKIPHLMTEIEANIESLKTGIFRVKTFLVSENKKSVSNIDELTLNLLLNSVSLSLSSLTKIVKIIDAKKYVWKRDSVVKDLASIIMNIRQITELYDMKPLKEDLKSLVDSIDEKAIELEKLVK